MQAAEEESAGSTAGVGNHDAKDVVMSFYAAYNAGDVDGVLAHMAPDCAYHDTIYLEPFQGKAAIRGYFEKVVSILPPDLQFRVERITSGDPGCVGVKWHVDLNGNEFPFSRGVSFYELNEAGQIIFARDCVEPALKPGSAALLALKALTPLVRKLGPNANPGSLKKVPKAALLLGVFYLGYMGFVFLSHNLPGSPVYQTSPRVLQEVFNESINLFYVNPGLRAAGVTVLPALAEHPVSEAVFNFIIAWSLMWWPLMVADPKGRVPNKFPLWIATMFLTNVFFIPYMALRELPSARQPEAGPAAHRALPKVARPIGAVAALVAIISLAWAPLARPEYGGLADRAAYFVHEFTSNRAFFAFCLDAVLYSVFQAVLLDGKPAQYRFVPYFGLAAYLMTAKGAERQLHVDL